MSAPANVIEENVFPRTEFGNCLFDERTICNRSLESTCKGMFKHRKGSIVDDKYIPRLPGRLEDIVKVWRPLGGGKSGAIVLLVSRKKDLSLPKPPKYILKVYLDAYDQFNDVNNERPFREVFTQCMVNGNSGYNCTVCFGKAPWPSSWFQLPSVSLRGNVTTPIMDARMFNLKTHPNSVLFLFMSLSSGKALMDLDLLRNVPDLLGAVLEIWAVWLKARAKLTTKFVHWDFHPDNIFVDTEKPRRNTINLPVHFGEEGKTTELLVSFPTVTVIDFDLVSSNVFPNELPEHVAKRNNLIGLTERALQWTMKWLPPSLFLRWIGFLIVSRKNVKLHEDLPHLWTYTFVLLLYFMTQYYPMLTVEQLGEHLFQIIRLKINKHVDQKLLQDIIRAFDAKKALQVINSDGDDVLKVIVFNYFGLSTSLLKAYKLLSQEEGANVARYSVNGIAKKLMQEVPNLDMSWLENSTSSIPIYVRRFGDLKEKMNKTIAEYYSLYKQFSRHYLAPDDIRLKLKLNNNSMTNTDERGIVINMFGVSLFLQFSAIKLDVDFKAFAPSFHVATDLSVWMSPGLYSRLVSEAWKKVKSLFVSLQNQEEETSITYSWFSNWKIQVRPEEVRGGRFQGKAGEPIEILKVTSLDIQMDPIKIVLTVDTRPEASQFIYKWVIEMLLTFVMQALSFQTVKSTIQSKAPQVLMKNVTFSFMEGKLQVEYLLPEGDAHPCLGSLQFLLGNPAYLGETLDCMDFVNSLIMGKPNPMFDDLLDFLKKYARLDTYVDLLNEKKVLFRMPVATFIPQQGGLHIEHNYKPPQPQQTIYTPEKADTTIDIQDLQDYVNS